MCTSKAAFSNHTYIGHQGHADSLCTAISSDSVQAPGSCFQKEMHVELGAGKQLKTPCRNFGGQKLTSIYSGTGGRGDRPDISLLLY